MIANKHEHHAAKYKISIRDNVVISLLITRITAHSIGIIVNLDEN